MLTLSISIGAEFFISHNKYFCTWCKLLGTKIFILLRAALPNWKEEFRTTVDILKIDIMQLMRALLPLDCNIHLNFASEKHLNLSRSIYDDIFLIVKKARRLGSHAQQYFSITKMLGIAAQPTLNANFRSWPKINTKKDGFSNNLFSH